MTEQLGDEDQVDAVDRSARMIEEARRRTPGNVHCVLADVLADPLPGEDYDAIVSISALHHMPLPDALAVLAAALRPGGILAAVAPPRPDLRHEWPVEIVAAVAHRLLGVVFLADRLLRGNSPFLKEHHGDDRNTTEIGSRRASAAFDLGMCGPGVGR